MTFKGCMTQLGELPIPFEDWEHVRNPFFAPCADVSVLETYMDNPRASVDSCGAKLRVVASNVPVGLGEPIYDRLDADIAHALMGLNAVKGVKLVMVFPVLRSVAAYTVIRPRLMDSPAIMMEASREASATGRILKFPSPLSPPVPSSFRAIRSIPNGSATVVQNQGHDPCVGIRATPIAEALLALVLMEHALRHRAQCADVHVVTPDVARRG